MTRRGYLLALLLFGASALLGVMALVPRPHEIGLTETLSCAEWLAAPREGHFELVRCEVDLRHPTTALAWDGDFVWARVQVPSTAWRTDTPSEDLFWRTTDPDLMALARRLDRDEIGSPERRRTLERFARALVTQRTLTGEIERLEGGDGYALSQPKNPPFFRAFAVVMLLFGLLGLLVLVPLQRRWSRRDRELGADGAQPLRF